MSEYPAFIHDAPRPAGDAITRPATQPAGQRPADTPSGVPGEAGLWVLLLGDMTVFALFFGAFLIGRADDPQTFAAAREHLTVALGAINTIVLLASSLFVALAVRAQRGHDPAYARRLQAAVGLCAAIFVALKGVEWGTLISADMTPATNGFFMFYFVITGVHLFHVLIGAGGLFAMRHATRPGQPPRRARLITECCASYWHMVDLLWVLIFPLLYFSAT